MAREFPLKVATGKPDPATMAMVDELLARPDPRTPRPPALGSCGRIGPVADGGDDSATKVRPYLGAETRPWVRAAALTALRSFPALWAERPVRARRSTRALGDADARVRVAAIRMALEPKAKVAESSLRKALDDPDPARADRLARSDRRRGRGSGATCGCSAW